ncbi:MAG TPA: hypothetical protein VM715_00015, partial [Candidatus Acidoferrum sp.]|nr:hypothetical protein [Candidatus Acidoferrum sp.]
QLTPVNVAIDPPALPFAYSISMGVRKGNVALRDSLERVLREQKSAIQTVLDSYGVPRVPLENSVPAISGN